MSEQKQVDFSEMIHYPENPIMKWFFQAPVFFWRLGLGNMLGRHLLMITTVGRKTGRARSTAVELHEHAGKFFAMSGYGERSDWVQNILADPHVTVQTADQTIPALARRVESDEELAEVYAAFENSPARRILENDLEVELSLEDFIARKDEFYFMTFDPTDEPTPPSLEADLLWMWPMFGGVFFMGWVSGLLCRPKRR